MARRRLKSIAYLMRSGFRYRYVENARPWKNMSTRLYLSVIVYCTLVTSSYISLLDVRGIIEWQKQGSTPSPRRCLSARPRLPKCDAVILGRLQWSWSDRPRSQHQWWRWWLRRPYWWCAFTMVSWLITYLVTAYVSVTLHDSWSRPHAQPVTTRPSWCCPSTHRCCQTIGLSSPTATVCQCQECLRDVKVRDRDETETFKNLLETDTLATETTSLVLSTDVLMKFSYFYVTTQNKRGYITLLFHKKPAVCTRFSKVTILRSCSQDRDKTKMSKTSRQSETFETETTSLLYATVDDIRQHSSGAQTASTYLMSMLSPLIYRASWLDCCTLSTGSTAQTRHIALLAGMIVMSDTACRQRFDTQRRLYQ